MLPCTAVDIQLCNFVPLEVQFRNSCTDVDLWLYSCISTTRVLYAYKLRLTLYAFKTRVGDLQLYNCSSTNVHLYLKGTFLERYQITKL